MAEDLVTLGFAFSSGNAETEINKLISALNNLDGKSQSAQSSVEKLFGGAFAPQIDIARKSIGKFNAGLVQTAEFAKKATAAIKPLPTQIASVSADKINPVPNSVIESLQLYANSVRSAADAMSRLKDIPSKLSPAPVRKLGREISNVNSETSSLFDTFKQTFATGTWAMYFKQSTQEAVKFGEQLAHINSLSLEFDGRIRSGLLNLSSTLGPAIQNAEALYYAFSSGVRGSEEDLVNFTGDMAKLATLIRAGVVPTVDAATSAMNAYNMSAHQSGELLDLFYGIVKQGKASGEQLATGLGQVISTAATAGVTLDEMGAAVSSLTKVMQTRNAITYYNNMLSKMIKPTKECRLAAEKLGIELGLDTLRAKGFSGMMQELHDKTKGSQQAILSIFPDLRGQRAALQLLNKGWGDFQNQLEYFANKSGVAQNAMNALSGDVYFQLSKLPNAFSKIKIAAGDLIVQTLTLGGALTPIITAFNNMGEDGQKVVAALTLITGGYAVLKTAQFFKHKQDLVEIRHQEVLSALRQKEVAERSAVATAVEAEAAAKTGASGMSNVSGSGVAPAAVVNPGISAALKQQQEYAALKLKLASDSVSAAVAKVKETEAIYQQNAALAQSAALKKADTAETAELTLMLEKDAAWRVSMLKQNQSHFSSISKRGIAEKELAEAALKRATADRIAAQQVAKLVAADSASADLSALLAKAEMEKAQAAALSASYKEKDIISAAKGAAAEHAENAAIAKANLTRTQRIALIEATVRERALLASFAYDDAVASYAQAKAAGSATDSLAAYKRMLAAKTEFLLADNKAERWNNLLLAQKSGLLAKNALMDHQNKIPFSDTNTIGNVAKTGVGFSGGFKAMFDTAAFTSSLKTSGSALKTAIVTPIVAAFKGIAAAAIHPIKSLGMLKTAISSLQFTGLASGIKSLGIVFTGFGAILGKVTAVITGIFTAANVIIAGTIGVIIGAVDMVQSLIRGKGLSEGTFILKPIAEWIVGIEKLEEIAKELDTHLATKLELHKAKKSVADFVTDVTASFHDLWKSDFEVPDMLAREKLEYFFGEFSRTMADHQEKYNATMLSSAARKAEKAREKFDSYNAEMIAIGNGGDKLNDKQKSKLEEYRKAWEEANANLKTMQDGAQESGTRLRHYANSMREVTRAQVDALSGIEDMIDTQRFGMMTPEQQNKANLEKIAAERNNYYRSFQEGNYSAAKNAFKVMIDTHNAVVKDAESKIKNYQAFQSNLKTDAFDYLLKSTQSLPEQLSAMRQRAQELHQESGGRWSQTETGQWNFHVPQASNADLEHSYAKARQAVDLHIQAMQKEIDHKNRLAQEEQRANENMLRLVQSMDKFNATTVTAVNAISLDAMQLRSRKFAGPVKMQPLTTAQTGLGSAQTQMNALLTRALQIVEGYRQAAAQREQAETKKRETLNRELNEAMQKNTTAILEWKKAMSELPTQIADAVKGAFGSAEDTARHLKNIHTIVKGIGTVSY